LFNGKPEPLDDKRPDRENGGRIPGLSAGDTDANRSPTIPSQWNQQLPMCKFNCTNNCQKTVLFNNSNCYV